MTSVWSGSCSTAAPTRTRGNAHGWTPLHQAAYSDLPVLARMLLDAGARVDVSARGDGGTPLIVALFWGNRTTAELLAAEGVHPRNLRAAAGLGDLALIDALGPEEAGAHRGFYRPHSGFPAWQPSDDPQEALDEALAWAARSDRADAVERLVARGADPAADVYRGTALAWAAACGRVATIRRLVALGADPNQPTTFGGPEHAQRDHAPPRRAERGHRSDPHAARARRRPDDRGRHLSRRPGGLGGARRARPRSRSPSLAWARGWPTGATTS